MEEDMNFGAVMIFARRAAQISAYLMLALNTVNLAGVKLGLWMWVIAGLVMAVWVIIDIRVVFPQEQDYSVRNSKTLMDGLNRWKIPQDD